MAGWKVGVGGEEFGCAEGGGRAGSPGESLWVKTGLSLRDPDSVGSGRDLGPPRRGSSEESVMVEGASETLATGRGPGPSSRLTEQPAPACVSLGKGSVIYDSSFDLFKEIGHLCRLCKAIAGNSELVKPGGAQCLPSGVQGEDGLGRLHGRTAPSTRVPGVCLADMRQCPNLHPRWVRGV